MIYLYATIYLCTLGDVKRPMWVLVTPRVVAVTALVPNPASSESPKTKGLIQIDPGEEREELTSGQHLCLVGFFGAKWGASTNFDFQALPVKC